MKNLYNLLTGSFCVTVGIWNLTSIFFLEEGRIFIAFMYLVLSAILFYVGWANIYVWKYDKVPKFVNVMIERCSK